MVAHVYLRRRSMIVRSEGIGIQASVKHVRDEGVWCLRYDN